MNGAGKIAGTRHLWLAAFYFRTDTRTSRTEAGDSAVTRTPNIPTGRVRVVARVQWLQLCPAFIAMRLSKRTSVELWMFDVIQEPEEPCKI